MTAAPRGVRPRFGLRAAQDNKKAIAAYQSALHRSGKSGREPALGQSLLNDNQLDEALKIYQDNSAGDPQDPQAYLRISEIQRRQGKYDQSLTTLKKAKALRRIPSKSATTRPCSTIPGPI